MVEQKQEKRRQNKEIIRVAIDPRMRQIKRDPKVLTTPLSH
jgi:hypothetical protein